MLSSLEDVFSNKKNIINNVNEDKIIYNGINDHLFTIKKLANLDVTWYSGITSVLYCQLRLDYIVIDNDTIEFSQYDYRSILSIQVNNRYNEYRIDTKTLLDNNITDNVRIPLNHIIKEYYS